MKILKDYNLDIVILGAGANGSHFFRNLLQDMCNYGDKLKDCRVLIADGDKVEKKNFKNQLFALGDEEQYKVYSLVERYAEHYDIDAFAVAEYVTDIDSLHKLFANDNRTKILIGCVDNNRSRILMQDYFDYVDDLIYIDLGVEGVLLRQELDITDPVELEETIMASGFSGQVVVGYKTNGQVFTPAIGEVYPTVYSDEESVFPTGRQMMSV